MNNVVGEGVVLNYITYIEPERLGFGIRENSGSVSFKGTVYVIASDLARSFILFPSHITFMLSYDSLKSFSFLSIISLTSSAAGNSIWGIRKMN